MIDYFSWCGSETRSLEWWMLLLLLLLLLLLWDQSRSTAGVDGFRCTKQQQTNLPLWLPRYMYGTVLVSSVAKVLLLVLYCTTEDFWEHPRSDRWVVWLLENYEKIHPCTVQYPRRSWKIFNEVTRWRVLALKRRYYRYIHRYNVSQATLLVRVQYGLALFSHFVGFCASMDADIYN